MSPRLPQSRSYFKILEISYFVNNTNLFVMPDIIESIIKSTHIFNNIVLASYSYIIKASSKFNMAVIWIDIWDLQNGMNAKYLINRNFNIELYIIMIRGININSSIPQYKNCWKWGNITFICCMHRAKCQKCNGLHKLKHYRDMVYVVATTCHSRTNDLTTSKALQQAIK